MYLRINEHFRAALGDFEFKTLRIALIPNEGGEPLFHLRNPASQVREESVGTMVTRVQETAEVRDVLMSIMTDDCYLLIMQQSNQSPIQCFVTPFGDNIVRIDEFFTSLQNGVPGRFEFTRARFYPF